MGIIANEGIISLQQETTEYLRTQVSVCPDATPPAQVRAQNTLACHHEKPIVCEDTEGHLNFARQTFPNIRIP